MLSSAGLDNLNHISTSVQYYTGKKNTIGLSDKEQATLTHWEKEHKALTDLLFHDSTGVLDELNTVKAASDVYDCFYKHLEMFDYFNPANNSCDMYDIDNDLPF